MLRISVQNFIKFINFNGFLSWMKELEQKLEKYLKLTAKGLNKVKIVQSREKEAEDILDLAKRYYSDAQYFYNKGDLVNAFGAVVYAHAFLDIGARIGLFDVGKDNKLFMVD